MKAVRSDVYHNRNFFGWIGKWLLRLIAIVVMWAFLLSFAAIYDLVHYGFLQAGILYDMAKSVEAFLSCCGMDYCNAYDILRDGFATLFTAMSIVLTIHIYIINRSSDKIYGVSRLELVLGDKEWIYHFFNRVIYGGPFVMAFAVNMKWTMTGYFILVAVYIYLICCYGIYSKTYNKQTNERCMIRYLERRFPKELDDTDGMSAYRGIMGDIYTWTYNTKDWQSVQELFYKMLREKSKWSMEQRFVQTYNFYDTVFLGNSVDNATLALETLFRSRLLLNRWDNEENEEESQRYQIMIWALICAAFEKLPDPSIVILLDSWLDFKGQIAALNVKQGDASCLARLRIQAGMALIMTEYRLNVRMLTSEVYKLFPTLWQQGRFIFAPENETLRERMIEYYQHSVVLADPQMDIYLNNLLIDYQNNSRNSIICTLID